MTSQPFLVMHGFRHSTCTSGLPAQSPHLLRLGCSPCCLTLWCVCPAGRSSRVLHQVPEGPAAHQAGSGRRGDRGGPHTPYPHHRGWQGVTSSLSSSPASVQAVAFCMWNLILSAGGRCLPERQPPFISRSERASLGFCPGNCYLPATDSTSLYRQKRQQAGCLCGTCHRQCCHSN